MVFISAQAFAFLQVKFADIANFKRYVQWGIIRAHSLHEGDRMNSLLQPLVSATLLRVSLGAVLLAHSLYLKLVVFTLAGTAQFFGSMGLPEFLAYVVFFIELAAGIALIVGFQTRLFAAMVIPVLMGATWAHMANGWLFSNAGGGWEYPLMLVVLAFVQLGLGDGKFALSSHFAAKQH